MKTIKKQRKASYVYINRLIECYTSIIKYTLIYKTQARETNEFVENLRFSQQLLVIEQIIKN